MHVSLTNVSGIEGENESCVSTYFIGRLGGIISHHQRYRQMTVWTDS